MLLSVPLSALNRVGKNTAQSLKKLGLETVRDLLFYFPFRYDDFSQATPFFRRIHQLSNSSTELSDCTV
jgi:ATP-dependent DNA helicase RecG